VSGPDTDSGDGLAEGDEGRPFAVSVITLFAEYFDGPLSASLLGKARERGDLRFDFVDPRDHTSDRHRSVDDSPYGGGPGMVLKAGPIVEAIEATRATNPGAPVVALTPGGRRLGQGDVEALARGPGMILVCGRYEGFDERIFAYVDDELSVGDFVLSGGEPAAVIVIDAVARKLPGVMGNEESGESESFAAGLLEYPQYTRPEVFRGVAVPQVLLSGNHAAIARWRADQAQERTRARRPDLLQLAQDSRGDAQRER
jgi:tRNA (guanine37-N1)-methyltransferase